MSSKFSLTDEDKSNELSFQQANSIYDVMRDHLRNTGDADIADQKYFIQPGRKALFNYPHDRSIATVKQTYVQVLNELAKDEDKNEFNEHKFEDMFTKYMQVLDTDYEGYMIVYMCQENMEFENSAGTEMEPEDVFKASVN